ncbi:acetylglutamate kinase [Methanosarcinales archaeon]|nr:MAG: acetylglutamate kinase [Methanosarcinales archaeon]
MIEKISGLEGCNVVIKLGGNLLNDDIVEDIADDIVRLSRAGVRPVVVHGGGHEISRMMERMGKEPVFVDGLRVTDKETLDIVAMVLCGKENLKLTSLVIKKGGKAVGLSGKDGKTIVGKRIEKLGWVGEVKEVKTELLDVLLERGYIPVISPIAIDDEGNLLNVNADIAAGMIAKALKADKLLILTDVPGILKVRDDHSSRIHQLRLKELSQLMQDGTVSEGMIPKLRAVMQALEGGVKSAHIMNGMEKHSILLELAGEYTGTVITV